jgi:hypothetical protein
MMTSAVEADKFSTLKIIQRKINYHVHCAASGSPLVLLYFNPCQERCRQTQPGASWLHALSKDFMRIRYSSSSCVGKILSGGLSFVP